MIFFIFNIHIVARDVKYNDKRSMDMNKKMTKTIRTIAFLFIYLLLNLVALLYFHENFYKSLCEICMKIVHICVYMHVKSLNDSWLHMGKANVAS